MVIVAGSILEGSYNRFFDGALVRRIVAGSILEGSYNMFRVVSDAHLIVAGSILEGSFNFSRLVNLRAHALPNSYPSTRQLRKREDRSPPFRRPG